MSVITKAQHRALIDIERERTRKAVAEVERLKAVANAWFAVHEASDALGYSIDPDPDDEMIAETERLAEVHGVAVDHAHAIDPGRRCPECKGSGGFMSGGSNIDCGGFVPCPECDGNPWSEVLEEMAHEAAQ